MTTYNKYQYLAYDHFMDNCEDTVYEYCLEWNNGSDAAFYALENMEYNEIAELFERCNLTL